MNTWLLLAHNKEIEGFRDLGEKANNVRCFETGIGLFQAQFTLNMLLTQYAPPERVILAGTAGSFFRDDIFKLKHSHYFSLPHSCNEELPDFLEKEWQTIPAIENTFEKNRDNDLVTLFSTFGISVSAENFRFKKGIFWENMEALSLSYTCYKNKIPFSALICCTNQIGPDARVQWKVNFQKAGVILNDGLKKLFDL